MVEKFVKDGQVAVLYSPGFGAGWSTWNKHVGEFFLFDKGLVELRLSDAKGAAMEGYLEKVLPEYFKVDSDPLYLGGWRGLTLKFLPLGTRFRIHEYDGSESVVVYDEKNYFIA
jgi:hypothetical protein